jgi:AcrR family transcriptional regulator
MRKPVSPRISARKKPRQARSKELVSDILEGALRVLDRHGAEGFTTVRVAAEAGVSVGSLYQYFPNKQALLFRLQADEWAETSAIFEQMLYDDTLPPLDRLGRAVLVFFRSEREEAELRRALERAGVRSEMTPQAIENRESVLARMRGFMAQALPGMPEEKRVFATELLLTSASAVAERITDERRSRAEIDAWAKASGEMFAAYLRHLAAPHANG